MHTCNNTCNNIPLWSLLFRLRMGKKVQFDPGAVLDRVISSAQPEDECYLYKLADFKKSGQLVDAFNQNGSKGLEDVVKKLGPLMYWSGKGELITRTEYMRWKYRNNMKEKICVDESRMTQFDPLLRQQTFTLMFEQI